MITKNSKDIIAILKWLQTNAGTKSDGRDHLEKIHIIRDTNSITLESTNGSSHTRAIVTGVEEHPIDLPDTGMYTMTLLSHQTTEWEEFTGRDFPDIRFLYPLAPKFSVGEPHVFSAVTGVDSSRMAKFLPPFMKSIQLCMNGAMLGIQGSCDIDDDHHSVTVTGLLMPMHAEEKEYVFDEKGSKIYKQSHPGAYLEILQPIPEQVTVPNSETEPEVEVAPAY